MVKRIAGHSERGGREGFDFPYVNNVEKCLGAKKSDETREMMGREWKRKGKK